MSKLYDQLFRIQMSKYFYYRFSTNLSIVFNFLFLFKTGRWWFHWWSFGIGIARVHQLCLTDTFFATFFLISDSLSARIGAD